MLLVNCLKTIKQFTKKAYEKKLKIVLELRTENFYHQATARRTHTPSERVEIHLAIFERKKKKPIDNEQLPIADIFLLSLTLAPSLCLVR